jgi:hypothetical protein
MTLSAMPFRAVMTVPAPAVPEDTARTSPGWTSFGSVTPVAISVSAEHTVSGW